MLISDILLFVYVYSVPLERLLKRSSPLYNVIYSYNTITATSASTTPTATLTDTITNTTSTDFTTHDNTAATSNTTSHSTSDKISMPSSSTVAVVDEVEKEGVSDIHNTTTPTAPYIHDISTNINQSSTEGYSDPSSSSYIHTSFPSNECLLYISDTAHLAVGPDNNPNNAIIVSTGFFLFTTHRLFFFPVHYAAALDNPIDRATGSSSRSSNYMSTHYPRVFPLSLSLNELSTVSVYYCIFTYVILIH